MRFGQCLRCAKQFDILISRTSPAYGKGYDRSTVMVGREGRRFCILTSRTSPAYGCSKSEKGSVKEEGGRGLYLLKPISINESSPNVRAIAKTIAIAAKKHEEGNWCTDLKSRPSIMRFGWSLRYSQTVDKCR